MQRITLLAPPACLVTSISLPLEILNAANELARTRNRKHPRLQIDIVSQDVGPVVTAGGLSVVASATPNMIEQTDLVIIPSLWRSPVKNLIRHRWIMPWLQRLAKQQSLICAVGTSSYFLAEAGLLDHQPATTHWHYCDQFAERYPQVDLKRQYLITQANTIYCVGSVNSIADLMVHFIQRHYGQTIARQVEAQFSPEIRRPFANHAYVEEASKPHQDETIIEAQEWLQRHLRQPINLAALAKQLQLSPRTFNRRFKQAVGITAGDYLQRQRLDNARELLRTSNFSVQEVAYASGYLDSSYFCGRFKKAMGQTPLAYRKSVRGKLFKVI